MQDNHWVDSKMKIKRYFARDMREALAKVREEQGPDAVILSNKKIDGGIEIVAAVDYDENLFTPALVEAETAPEPSRETAAEAPAASAAAPHVVWSQDPSMQAMRDEINGIRELLETQLSGLAWGELGKRKPVRAALVRKLSSLGLTPRVVRELAAQAPETLGIDAAWRKALGVFAHRIPSVEDQLLNDGGVIALLGPTGVGKTTTAAKLAARFALRHGAEQVALVTADTYRVGAVEQLRTYARIMNVPVRVTKNTQELRSALEDLYDRRLVIVDTAGMSQRDVRLGEQLKMITDGSPMVQPYLVMSAVSQYRVAEESIRAFSKVDLDGCIITKLDECSELGGLLSALIEHQLPVAYTTNGQRVPEDLQPARAHNLVSKAVALAGQRSKEETDMELAYGGLAADGAI